jgi:hypothetical protein
MIVIKFINKLDSIEHQSRAWGPLRLGKPWPQLHYHPLVFTTHGCTCSWRAPSCRHISSKLSSCQVFRTALHSLPALHTPHIHQWHTACSAACALHAAVEMY